MTEESRQETTVDEVKKSKEEPKPSTDSSADSANHPAGSGREAEQPAGSGSAREAEEPSGSGSEEPAGSDAVEKDLAAMLEDVTRERDEYLDLARRAKADFENYRKRSTQQIAEAATRGKAELARELLPAIDNLERALADADVENDAFAKGVALVRDGLLETLKRAGVEAYDPAGEKFDPTCHEALSTRPEEGVESGTVVEVLDRGYRLDGQVLRPARVVVSE